MALGKFVFGIMNTDHQKGAFSCMRTCLQTLSKALSKRKNNVKSW